MARKKQEEPTLEPLPTFEVRAVQHVELNFPYYDYGYGLKKTRMDWKKNLTREEARELADQIAQAANRINE